MNTELIDTLDTATERLAAGDGLPSILADFPEQAETLRPLLDIAAGLEDSLPVVMPGPNQMWADRDAFLTQVKLVQQQPVSPPLAVRLKEWIVPVFSWQPMKLAYQRKEHRSMSGLLFKAMLVISLMFGATGGTAVMAANSLPDSPVYPVKLSMEQARLALTSDPADQANLHMQMAETRAQEMMQLALNGNVPDKAVQTRLQTQLNLALQLAAGLNEAQLHGVLTQARAMLQTQQVQFTQTQAQIGDPAQAALAATGRFMHQVQQDVETGLTDPLAFRNRYGKNRSDDAPTQPENQPERGQQAGPPEEQPVEPPAVGPGPNGPNCEADDCDPARNRHQTSQGDELPAGYQHQHGQDAEKPGNPDCPDRDCEPLGDQHQNQYGQNADDPGGPNCPDGDCEPVGDENKYGQQEDNTGGPHGDQDCTNDCEPQGDQHQNQYGQDAEEPGGPHGDPNCPDGDCEPQGDQHQNGPTDEAPPPETPVQDGLDGHGGGVDNGQNGGSDNSGGGDSGSSKDSGGSSGDGGGGKK
jgi:uncharacterized membrane protein YgcG